MLTFYLTNDEACPLILTECDKTNVNIEIHNRSDEIIFSDNRVPGFWRNNGIAEELLGVITSCELDETEDAHRILVQEYLRTIEHTYGMQNIPDGFEIDDGLYSYTENTDGVRNQKLISYTPLWVPCQYRNGDTNEIMVDIAFYTPTGMTVMTLPQKEAFQRRGIMEIAGQGVLLEESKTSAMINWLVTYIHHNEIPTDMVFERFGWKDGLKFVMGDKAYSDNLVENVKIINIPTKSVEGLSNIGDIETWINVTSKILEHDKARFKCYAACTAPLLKLLKQKSFLVHDFGETSTGKTLTSELGMSIWGNPAKLIMSSFGTTVGKERLATLFTDLPLLIDETQMSTEEDNKTLIYLIANETGKLRGMKEGGLQNTASWKTIAFTTGEAPLTSDKSFMGMAMRVVEIYGGLGVHDKEAVDDYKNGIEGCYGVMGPLIIQEIIDDYNNLLSKYTKLNAKFNEMASDMNLELDGVGGRSASMFAIITLGGYIFEEVMRKKGGVQKDAGPICAYIFEEYIESMPELAYSKKAYQHFRSWVGIKDKYFIKDMVDVDDSRSPYDLYGNITKYYIDIFPTILKDVLEKGGFSYKRVLKDWKVDGTLEMYYNKHDKEFSSHMVTFKDKMHKVKRININNIEQ